MPTQTKSEDYFMSPEDQCALEKVEKSLKNVDGRYQVGIPWKEDNPILPDNYEMALRRLINTERRLLKSPEWYLPHFPVVREDKETTKARIVYDSAARYGGVSLNDNMLPGPKLQQDVFDVLSWLQI